MATARIPRPVSPAAHPAMHLAARPSSTQGRPRWYVEIAIVAFFYGGYERSRAAAPTHPGLALRHAHTVMTAEHSLHLGAEHAVNRVFAAHEWLGALGGYYYATMHFVVTVAVLVWLYCRRPDLYRRARTMLVLASFAALAVYVLYPVTPPRLAMPGMTDILVTHNVLGAAHAAKSGGFVNIYAAMPSLHVGWAVWSAMWIQRAHPASRWRHLVWLYPLTTSVVVLGTANHYVLDALAGLGLMLTAAAATSPRLRARFSPRRHSPESGATTSCEVCNYDGPRRYLVTFVSMLEANGMHVALPVGNDEEDLSDLAVDVRVTLPVDLADAIDQRSLDDVIDDFRDWGADLARVTHPTSSGV